ncbi:MAG TPA: ABC transporter ATP-binding protein [Rhodospirillaceae bacterium]|nr:ABC transporter ATP-binding protein [Rhodospirillaceae bacterium]|tara:strand:+ start:326 stop:1096 length:771 start_codon:yes stop_codon:yes gene_type:complete
MSEPKIQLRGVAKAFGPKKVLTGVDLDVAKGESVVIIGGSGTGKSVTLKCILGLLTPDSGSIKIDGREVTGLSVGERDDINRQVGMLFQGGALFDSLPVWENVAFGLLSRKQCGREEAREIAIKKLAQVGLKPALGDAMPADLSIGMQKRVGLARAIATDPEIIFFDEPTTGLDPIMADMINELIVHVNQEVGATALSISHDMDSARRIGDRIAMLYQGKIVWAGAPGDIDGEVDPVVDQFVHGRVDGPIKMQVRA